MSSGPHPSAPLSQAQMAQQQQAQVHANELAKRRSRKPTDKNMPDGVEDSIVDPESVQRYKDLRELERLLDATTTRKRLDISESVNRSHGKVRALASFHLSCSLFMSRAALTLGAIAGAQLKKTLRIWITNSVEDQVWQGNGLNVDAFDFTPNMEASYRVKVEGRLLHDNDENEEGRAAQESDSTAQGSTVQMDHDSDTKKLDGATATEAKHRFSHFFKAITVDFDRSRFRNGAEQTVEWKKPESGPKSQAAGASSAVTDFDELTFKRNGDENTNITINLFRQELPERFLLSPELAEVVDMSEATQQEAVMALWEYIRFWGLQEDEEKRNFRCDEPLKKVSGSPGELSGDVFPLHPQCAKRAIGRRPRRCRVYSHAQRIRHPTRPTATPHQPALHDQGRRGLSSRSAADCLRRPSSCRRPAANRAPAVDKQREIRLHAERCQHSRRAASEAHPEHLRVQGQALVLHVPE